MLEVPRRAHSGETAGLSPTQRRFWLNEQLYPGTSFNNVAVAYRLEGALDVGAFEQAVERLGELHHVLLMELTNNERDPQQHFDTTSPLRVDLVDLRRIPSGRVQDHMDLVASQPFDVHNAPLIRLVLFRSDERSHSFLIALHHLLGDGWSLGVFVGDLTRIYNQLVAGQKVDPVRTVRTFAEYARLASQGADDDRRLQQVDYWRAKLRSGVEAVSFPAEQPRPRLSSIASDAVTAHIDSRQTAAVDSFARASSISRFAVLLSALSVMMARYNNTRLLPIGLPVANRRDKRFATVIGPFMNTVVIQSDLQEDPTFRELAAATHSDVQGALANQELPFDTVFEETGSTGPMFEVLCMYQNMPLPPLALAGICPAATRAHTGSTRFDLTVVLEPAGDGIELLFEFKADIFCSEEVQRIAEGYLALVRAAVLDPDCRWDRLPVMSQAVSQLVTPRQSQPTLQSVGPATAVAGVEAQARQRPYELAVVATDASLVYHELVEMSARVARRLQEAGIRTGDRVAVLQSRDSLLLPTLLGIWQAGAAYVPLDAAAPTERLRFMLNDSGACLLVADGPVGSLNGPSLSAAQLTALPASEAGQSALPAIVPDDLAYVIYTSGSTGRPKGVAVRHRSVANLLKSMTAEPGFRSGEQVLAITPVSFDISVLELFLPLVNGGQVVLLTRDDVSDAQRLCEIIAEHPTALMQATPSTWRMLLDAGWDGTWGLRALCGGEPLTADLSRDLLARVSELWNMYGPTETTVWSTVERVRPNEARSIIGHPIANTYCYVLDEQSQPLPPAVSGELYIGGDGLAAGYWERPDLTSERFISDPIDPSRGLVYRTGDVARLLGDGRLEILGRTDQQVKVRGHRVELLEIESILLLHPEVQHCAAVLLDRSGESVIGVVVAGEELVAADILGFLRTQLPAVMIPSVVRMVETIPLTISGKVDRGAVQALLRHQPKGERPSTRTGTALTDTQDDVLAFWAEMLRVSPAEVDIDESLFAMGGTSLTGTRLVAALERQFEVRLSFAAFFANPTVRALAQAIEDGGPEQKRSLLLQDPRRAGNHEARLSLAQRRFWLLGLVQDPALNNVAVRFSVRGVLDVGALECALNDVVTRHDVLRSSLQSRDDGPVQIAQPAAVQLEVADLAGLAEPSRSKAAAEWSRQEAARTFELGTPPLIRMGVARTGGDTLIIVLAVHHAVFDNWSLSILCDELGAFYRERTGFAIEQPQALRLRYADFAEWQVRERERGGHEVDLDYWVKQLADYEGVVAMPTDHPRAAVRSVEGAVARLRLGPQLAKRLEGLAAESGTTLFMVLLAGVNVLLHLFSGQEDIVVGTPAANRDPVETEKLIGCFINILPLRTTIDREQTVMQYLEAVRSMCADAYEHRRAAFEDILDRCELGRDMSSTPLVQVMLVWENGPPAALSLPGAEVRGGPADTGVAKYDLTVALWPAEDGGIDGTLEYSAALFEVGTAQRLCAVFTSLLRSMSQAPESTLGTIVQLQSAPSVAPTLPEESLPATRALEHEFDRLASRRGEAEAVRYGGRSLSYDQLHEQSEGLASALCDVGVATGSLVAVLQRSGFGQVAAVCGVLRLGAAYVVLDDRDPPSRHREVLSESGASALLIDEAARYDPAGLVLLSGGGQRPAVVLDRLGAVVEVISGRAGVGGGEAEQTEGVDERADAMFVVYTSGTGGRPKGIPHRRRTIAQFVDWQRERFTVDAQSRVAMWSPFSYDAAYTELFLALFAGAAVCVPTLAQRIDASAMTSWLRSECITHFEVVPSFARAMGEVMEAEEEGFPELQHCLFAGEALSMDVARMWRRWNPDACLHNLYGPTECILATHHELGADDDRFAQAAIGQAIPGRQVLVLDSELQPCPVGAVGDLYIRSEQLAGRYVTATEAATAVYVRDPFDPSGDGVIYRTGDRGRWRVPALLEFLGRHGSQLKVRGNRVEVEEIEHALQSHGGVKEAAVRAFAGENGDLTIVAYAVLHENTYQPDMGRQLRAHLAASLPGYMVPDHVVLLEALPRTRTNKLDRAALARPRVARGDLEGPRDEVEALVSEAWQSVLGRPSVGRTENFFECGGNSLVATRLHTVLKTQLERPIQLLDIFTHPTVAEFASWLRDGTQESSAARDRGRQRRLAATQRRRAASKPDKRFGSGVGPADTQPRSEADAEAG